jgi:hypothetical protein
VVHRHHAIRSVISRNFSATSENPFTSAIVASLVAPSFVVEPAAYACGLLSSIVRRLVSNLNPWRNLQCESA